MTGAAPRARVVLVDDSQMVLTALVALVDVHPRMEVVGTAADGHDGVAEVMRTAPDVVLLDMRMPNMDGIEAARRILEKMPGTRIVMVSAYDDASLIEAAMAAGVSRFVRKGSAATDIYDAILAGRAA